ncbi:MAG: BrnT family toxin [Candidatus Obscuribacterales bacterium]|nr:BrnT family toxin [Candidatus Obscuribacterales bacterium]
MIIQFMLNGLRFQYDYDKGRSNFNKHHIHFEKAALVFFDTLRTIAFNGSYDDEERWETIGLARGLILFVVYTERKNEDGQEVTHLISARKADKRERERMDLKP